PTASVRRSTAPPSWSSVISGGSSGDAARKASFIRLTAPRLATLVLRNMTPPMPPAAISSRRALTDASSAASPTKPTATICPAICSRVCAAAGVATRMAPRNAGTRRLKEIGKGRLAAWNQPEGARRMRRNSRCNGYRLPCGGAPVRDLIREPLQHLRRAARAAEVVALFDLTGISQCSTPCRAAQQHLGLIARGDRGHDPD